MKKIILISLFGLMFSQNEVSQRVYDFEATNGTWYKLEDIIGNDNLDWAILNVVGTPTGECHLEMNHTQGNNSMHILRSHNYEPEPGGILYYPNQGNFSDPNQGNSSAFYIGKQTEFRTGLEIVGIEIAGTYTIKILVTAEFPDEDDAMFDTGDLNEDEAVNVVDVVVLVNSILGIG